MDTLSLVSKTERSNHGQEDGLLNHRLFRSWGDLDPLGPSIEFPAEMVLGRQELIARDVYFIERGLVRLTRVEERGRRSVVGLRTPGWLLGASAAILQKAYPATMVTVTRCRLRKIRSDQFCRLLKTNDQFSWYVAVLHSQEVYDHVAQVTCLPYLSVR